MLDSLRNFISELAGGNKHPGRFEENDYRLAAAALLVHAASIDGKETGAEHDKLRAILKSRFALDDAATDELINVGTAAEHEAVDLYHFTSLINRTLDEKGRLAIVDQRVRGQPDVADRRLARRVVARSHCAAPACRRRARGRRERW
jgi:uncharacterized tellurite resistance protein B-like protein